MFKPKGLYQGLPYIVWHVWQHVLILQVGEISNKAEGGFNHGVIHIEGYGDYQGKKVEVDLQNENLVAKICDKDEGAWKVSGIFTLVVIYMHYSLFIA